MRPRHPPTRLRISWSTCPGVLGSAQARSSKALRSEVPDALICTEWLRQSTIPGLRSAAARVDGRRVRPGDERALRLHPIAGTAASVRLILLRAGSRAGTGRGAVSLPLGGAIAHRTRLGPLRDPLVPLGHGHCGGLRLYRLNSWLPRSDSRNRLRASRNRWLAWSAQSSVARGVAGRAGAGLRASLASRRCNSACQCASPWSHVSHHAIGSSACQDTLPRSSLHCSTDLGRWNSSCSELSSSWSWSNRSAVRHRLDREYLQRSGIRCGSTMCPVSAKTRCSILSISICGSLVPKHTPSTR